MSTRPRSRLVLPCALACGLLTLRAALSAEPPAANEAAPLSEEAILRALDKPISIRLGAALVHGAAPVLEDRLGVPVRFDERAVQGAGPVADAPITLALKNVSGRAALNLIIAESKLAWTVRHGGVWITTPEEASAHMRTRVYPVADLVPEPKAGEPWDPCDALVRMAQCLVSPDSWDVFGGKAVVRPFRTKGVPALVVQQTARNHDQVQTLLSALRGFRGQIASGKGPRTLCFPPRSPAEQSIDRALAKTLALSYSERTLRDVFADLATRLDVNVLADWKALDDAGLRPDSPVTFSTRPVAARTALDLMLRDLDLDWLVRDDVLWITTAEEAEEFDGVRFYEVSDLVLPPRRAQEADPAAGADFDSIIDLITSTVRPTAWPDGTGPGPVQPVVLPGLLMIAFSGQRPLHEDTERLLATLRSVWGVEDPARLPTAIRLPWYPESERAIDAALRKPVALDYARTPMAIVADDLADKLGVPLRIDVRSLRGNKVSADAPVTARLAHVSAGSALTLLLRPLELTWMVRDETLWITTPDEAETRYEARLYPVGDLLLRIEAKKRPSQPGFGAAGDAQSSSDFFGPDAGGPTLDFDSLIGVLRRATGPLQKDENDFAHIAPYRPMGTTALLGWDLAPNHRAIEAVLDALRRIRQRRDGKPVAARQDPDAAPVHDALAKQVQIDLERTPLEDAADRLGEKLQVHVELDRAALAKAGVKPDAAATLSASGVSGRIALDRLLETLRLAWIVRDGSLAITTPQEAAAYLTVKVYDVTDLWPDAQAKPGGDGEHPFIENVRQAVDPRGAGVVVAYSGPNFHALILRQPRESHERAEAFLAQLRVPRRGGG